MVFDGLFETGVSGLSVLFDAELFLLPAVSKAYYTWTANVSFTKQVLTYQVE